MSPAPLRGPKRAKPRHKGSRAVGVKRSMADMEAAFEHAAAARELVKRARQEARRAPLPCTALSEAGCQQYG